MVQVITPVAPPAWASLRPGKPPLEAEAWAAALQAANWPSRPPLMELDCAPALALEPPNRPADWAAAAAWALHDEKEGGKKMGTPASGAGGVSGQWVLATNCGLSGSEFCMWWLDRGVWTSKPSCSQHAPHSQGRRTRCEPQLPLMMAVIRQ